MTVVRQGCDSFDIMPADTARRQGRVPLLSTRTERFIASFSGGKDSQVVLDLCTRALPPDAFEVVYSDTGYELPSSLRLWQQVQDTYGVRFPALRFVTARNHQDILYYWDHIGTPSDTHRWCCSVMKTAPLYRSLKVGGRPSRVMCFDGVRAEESVRRSGYGRVGQGKYARVVNAHPILHWNTVEIFCYLFLHHLPINPAYRAGKARVGCLVCPFSSSWDDCITCRTEAAALQPFTDRLAQYAQEAKIADIDSYIGERKWKLKPLAPQASLSTRVTYTGGNGTPLTVVITHPESDLATWLWTLGPLTLAVVNETTKVGDVTIDGRTYAFRIADKANSTSLAFSMPLPISVEQLIRRLAQKAAHCLGCEVCELDCPTGALSVTPQLNIDRTKCTHCHRCLTSHDQGCVVADSKRMAQDTEKSGNEKVQSYKSFGLRKEWMDDYLADQSAFWTSGRLGKPQYEAFQNWLCDAGMLARDDKGRPTRQATELLTTLEGLYAQQPQTFWEVAFTNLSYVSYVAKWFIGNVDFHTEYTSTLLKERILGTVNGVNANTLDNALRAFCDTLRKSPLGGALSQGVAQDAKKQTFARRPASTLTLPGMVYSLYRSMRERGVKLATVSDFYPSASGARPAHGPWAEFGLERSELEKALRWLTLQDNRVLVAELNMGLEHITLRDDLTPLAALRISIEQWTVASQQPAAQVH